MNKCILIIMFLIVGGAWWFFQNVDGDQVERVDDNYNETVFVMPIFETELWTMGLFERQTYILYLENASSYIIPDNEVVQWYANNTVLTDDALLWKHDNSLVEFNYVTDNDLFENLTNGDMWQNPDYYLSHKRRGDCEDFSVAYASILEAKGISAQVVGVKLINGMYHWVVQYQYNNRTNYADINRNSVIIRHGENLTVLEEFVSIDRNNITML